MITVFVTVRNGVRLNTDDITAFGEESGPDGPITEVVVSNGSAYIFDGTAQQFHATIIAAQRKAAVDVVGVFV